MIIKDKEYGKFDVYLVDDGTIDTVISVNPLNQYIIDQIGTKDISFSQEYGAEFRDEDGAMTDSGFGELAKESVEAYIAQYLI